MLSLTACGRRCVIDKALFGHAITILGVLVLSPDSLTVRLVADLPNYTSILVKFGMYSATIFIGMIVADYISDESMEYYLIDAYDRILFRFKNIGYLGLGAGIWWGLSNLAFMSALQHTAVANVLVIMATNPIFSAIASFFLLGEKINFRTGITSVVGFTIIAIIFAQDINENDSHINSIKGICFAVFSTLSYGSYFVLIRLAGKMNSRNGHGGQVDLNACNIISGLVVVLITACLGGGDDLDKIEGENLLYLCIQGIFILPISFTLLIIGPQYILAPEVCLYSFLETVLGPLWVWLGGFERPPTYTVYGGIVLLIVLGGNSIMSIREVTRVRSTDEGENDQGIADVHVNASAQYSPKKLFQFQKIMPDVVVSNDHHVITTPAGGGW